MRKLIRFCFYHFYHSFAWSYDLVAQVVSIGRWKEWERSALAHVRGPRVLEIGFGPGHLQLELSRMGMQAIGLDESWQMIHRASTNLLHAELPTLLTRGIAQELPYAANSMDTVLSSFPSEYISDIRTLAEILRVLKPGSRLVVLLAATLNHDSLPDRAANWLFKITGQTMDANESLDKRIESMLRLAGFTVQITHTEIHHSTVVMVLAGKPLEK